MKIDFCTRQFLFRKTQEAFDTKKYEIIKSPHRIKKLEYKLEDLIAKRRKERKIAISSN